MADEWIPTGPHLTFCPLCGNATTWEAVESLGSCDNCFEGEHPEQIRAEHQIEVHCARLKHPAIIGGSCLCGKRLAK